LFHARRDWVAESAANWQESHMNDQPQSRGGGIFIVIGIAIGTAVGTAIGQSSAGLVAGIAVGAGIAVAFWLRDRKRAGR
jgi:UDP-N-acetylmuramyl pentapeptide phosphotransferase/UDP-N-acetylglucosamine-1-phosphate transferase